MILYIFEKADLITRENNILLKGLGSCCRLCFHEHKSFFVQCVCVCVCVCVCIFRDAAEITSWLLALSICFDFHLTVQFDSCLACSAPRPCQRHYSDSNIKTQHGVCFNGKRILRGGIFPTRGALQVYFQSESSVSFLFQKAGSPGSLPHCDKSRERRLLGRRSETLKSALLSAGGGETERQREREREEGE